MTFSLPTVVLPAFCVLLALGLTVAAIRRPNRHWLAGRIVAGWLACAGLWAMAQPPTHTVRQAAGTAILLTPGYQPDSLRQLLQKLGPATPIYRYEKAIGDTPAVRQVAAMFERQLPLHRLHILGNGLPPAEADALPANRLVIHPPAVLPSIQTAGWPHQLTTGQPFWVEGRLAKSAATSWVVLRMAGVPQDSVRLSPGNAAFRLQTIPRTTGPAVFELVLRQNQNILAVEPLPVEVLPAQPLRVLLLSSAPSFEFKFLKNHLAARQHAVGLRVGVSRNTVQTELVNQTAHAMASLNSLLLSRYDVVVADAGILSALSAEVSSLRAAVQKQGLGLIVLAEGQQLPTAMPGRAGFTLRPIAATEPRGLRWPGMPAGKPTAAVTATLQLPASTYSLVSDQQQRVVVARHRVGLGQVVVSTVPETFSWLLQNTPAVYDAYWSLLLTAAARPQPVAASWKSQPYWPRPNQPLTLQLSATGFPATPPVVRAPSGNTAPLALEQDSHLPEWSTAKYWPATAGWHQVQLAQQPPNWVYVYPDSVWPGPQRLAWQQRLTTQPSLQPGNGPHTYTREVAWPRWWFFILFVAAAGFMWLEEKL
ncbi:hypothetical protein [Hymenobacter sp. BT730]|uniref:hypothetical protein n=1 Tax=Hymenobacter sp. BT730 TaxID=3063332 RepID=UPI0026E002E7|nr:hypothetical protein [Hymenobacter sp. BT730]